MSTRNYEDWVNTADTTPYAGMHVAFVPGVGVVASSTTLDDLLSKISERADFSKIVVGIVTGEPLDEWVSIDNRLPADADGDDFQEVFCSIDGQVSRKTVQFVQGVTAQKVRGLNFHWMRTGVVKPLPPTADIKAPFALMNSPYAARISDVLTLWHKELEEFQAVRDRLGVGHPKYEAQEALCNTQMARIMDLQALLVGANLPSSV